MILKGVAIYFYKSTVAPWTDFSMHAYMRVKQHEKLIQDSLQWKETTWETPTR